MIIILMLILGMGWGGGDCRPGNEKSLGRGLGRSFVHYCMSVSSGVAGCSRGLNKQLLKD